MFVLLAVAKRKLKKNYIAVLTLAHSAVAIIRSRIYCSNFIPVNRNESTISHGAAQILFDGVVSSGLRTRFLVYLCRRPSHGHSTK